MAPYSYELTTTPAAARWLVDEMGRRGLADFALCAGGRRLVRVDFRGNILVFQASADDLCAALAANHAITRNGREVLFPLVAARLALKRLPEAGNLLALHDHPSRAERWAA